MNPEKMIRTEAKRALQNNWSEAVTVLVILLLIPLGVIALLFLAYYVIGDIEVENLLSESPIRAVLFVLIHVAAVAVMLLLSPLYTGFIRYFGKIAHKREVSVSEIFHFFEDGNMYKKSVSFMSVVLIKCFGILLACESLTFICVFLSKESGDVFGYASVVFGILGAVAAFLIMHRFNLGVMLFSYCDFDGITATKTGAAMTKNNIGKLLKLTAVFFPWILVIPFLGVPIMYVIPYATCSHMVSMKYISDNYFQNIENSANSENIENSGAIES